MIPSAICTYRDESTERERVVRENGVGKKAPLIRDDEAATMTRAIPKYGRARQITHVV